MAKNNSKDRELLWLIQRGRCFWCDRPTEYEKTIGPVTSPTAATVDHIVSRHFPQARQLLRRWRWWNTVMACHECNAWRCGDDADHLLGGNREYARAGAFGEAILFNELLGGYAKERADSLARSEEADRVNDSRPVRLKADHAAEGHPHQAAA